MEGKRNRLKRKPKTSPVAQQNSIPKVVQLLLDSDRSDAASVGTDKEVPQTVSDIVSVSKMGSGSTVQVKSLEAVHDIELDALTKVLLELEQHRKHLPLKYLPDLPLYQGVRSVKKVNKLRLDMETEKILPPLPKLCPCELLLLRKSKRSHKRALTNRDILVCQTAVTGEESSSYKPCSRLDESCISSEQKPLLFSSNQDGTASRDPDQIAIASCSSAGHDTSPDICDKLPLSKSESTISTLGSKTFSKHSSKSVLYDDSNEFEDASTPCLSRSSSSVVGKCSGGQKRPAGWSPSSASLAKRTKTESSVGVKKSVIPITKKSLFPNTVKTVFPSAAEQRPAEKTNAMKTVFPSSAEKTNTVKTVFPSSAEKTNTVKTVFPSSAEKTNTVKTVFPSSAEKTNTVKTVFPSSAEQRPAEKSNTKISDFSASSSAANRNSETLVNFAPGAHKKTLFSGRIYSTKNNRFQDSKELGFHALDSSFMDPPNPQKCSSKEDAGKEVGEEKCFASSSGTTENNRIKSCPICQVSFSSAMLQTDMDAHIAACLSASDVDIIW